MAIKVTTTRPGIATVIAREEACGADLGVGAVPVGF
jgi:hypothetical protein